jgi:hypothetical protein
VSLHNLSTNYCACKRRLHFCCNWDSNSNIITSD